ncbi:MAG: NAD(P)/FAD-dependent oxidoreductase [Chloroflexi bacterium]|nr:MAG: NAD(P)/FAD-dependent oxidoreductase [Chloroflexota bacterium]
MPEGQGPEPPGIRLRAGAEARRQARGPLRARDQEEAEAAEIAAPGHRRHTGDREDGQPAAQRRRPAISAAVSIRRPRVVIAGAGFGGLTCARGLKHAPVDVLLVDRNNYHLFTPLLYQVASALLEPSEIARPVRQLIRPLSNADFLQASITGVDFVGRRLLTDQDPIPYDYLVLATGAQSDHFGNVSVAQHGLGLKDLDEGLALRNRILSRFEASRWTRDPDRRRALLSFAVVGGGPTGVEMAGAISELIRLVLRKDYRQLDINEVRVVLIEAAPHVLGAFVPSLREAARRSLERKGIEVMLGAKVEAVTDGSVRLAGGQEIPACTVIWTAGVKGSDVGKATGVQLVRQSRIKVDGTLQVPGHPVVFVIGDLAGASDGTAMLPMLIPVAMQAGRHVADSISDMVANGGARAFRYKDPGIMATIGRNSAVAQLGWVHLSGFLGWLMWLGVHLVNVISFRSRIVVLVNWAWDYIFYDRPVRLIVRARP